MILAAKAAVPALIEVLNNDPDPEVRKEVSLTLSRASGALTVDGLTPIPLLSRGCGDGARQAVPASAGARP